MTDSPSQPATARKIFADTATALRQQPWCADACDLWPAPVASEVAQLLAMLDEGLDAGGVLMQVRDTAEVLLKTLTVIAAADLIAHGGPGEVILARQTLFSGQMSLGNWKAALASFAGAARTNLLVPELLDLAAPKGAFIKAMDAYIGQRNSDIGHGAYRPDSVEIAKRVRQQLLGSYDEDQDRRRGGIDRAFEAVAATRLWESVTLHCDTADGPLFAGAATVRGLRAVDHAHHGHLRTLFLAREGRALNLSPFLAGRICGECGERDAFLFDSPHSPKPKDDLRFDFLDYANGHHLRVNAAKTDPALVRLADLDDVLLQKRELDTRGEFASRDVVQLLDDIMFDNRFISPEWLRGALRRHMEAHSSGIFWLQAPGHIGKTMFVRGLLGEGLGEKARDQQRALLGKDTTLDVAALFLKREYRFDITQFASSLENQVRRDLRMDTRLRLVLPTQGTPKELQEGFVEFATVARRASMAKRLIIAVDGLDELRDPEGHASVIDYIPPAAALPDDVTLLLTSRPPEDCPEWLKSRLKQEFAPGRDVHSVGLEDVAYRDLLRTYIGRHSGVSPKDSDFAEVCDAVLERSGALFLIVSFLCDLIRDGATVEPAENEGKAA